MSPSATEQPWQMFTTAQKCCPVLIEKNSNVGLLRCGSTALDVDSKFVAGSWSSDPLIYGSDPLATVKAQLEEAMRDDRAAENLNAVVGSPYTLSDD